MLKLYVDGYNMHKDNRPDYFSDKSVEELANTLKEELIKNVKKYIVVETDNKIVGYCAIVYREKKIKTIWVDEFYIDSNYRKMGFGKKLIDKIKELGKENNSEKIELNCWSFNDNAFDFYKHIGFNEQRVIMEYDM